MKKHAVVGVAGLALVAALFAGCGTSNKTTTTTASPSSVTSTSTTSPGASSVTSTSAPGGSTTTLASTTGVTIIPGSANVTYTNTKYGFSLKRPKTATVVTSGFSGSLPLTNKPVVGIVLPKSLLKGTNLIGAAVYIGASSSSSVTAAWDKALPGESSGGTKAINGVTFAVFTFTDEAAGNIYDSTIYRTVRKGVCFEVVELLHSGNIGNYPAGSVKQFDKSKFQGYLGAIASTLTFK